MKLKGLLNHISLPLLLMASLCACSRFIEGDAFLDKNANNVRDFGEPVIAGLPYSVTREEAQSQSGVTDEKGHFFVTAGINDVNVKYCVNISSEDMAALVEKRFEKTKALKAATTSPEATAEACPLIVGKPDCNNKNCCDEALCTNSAACEDPTPACTKKSDGTPDCSDSDCCSESECSDAVGCQKKSDTNACPKDADGDPDCKDSRCSGETACNSYTVKAMQACDKTKASKLTMTLEVPVAMDYTSRVGKLDAVSSGPVSVGDKFGIEITYPSSCTFDPYTLTSAFAPIGLGDAYNASTRELKLAKAILDQPSQVIKQDLPPFGQDELHTYVLRLEMLALANSGDGDVKIQPTLTCPDGKKVKASANVIAFQSGSGNATPAFTIDASIIPACPALGESATLKTSIQAEDPAAYSGATTTIFLGSEGDITINSMPSQCQDKGATIECDMDTLHLGAKAEFSINFSMADSVANPTSVSFTPQLVADGAQFNDSAIVCEYP